MKYFISFAELPGVERLFQDFITPLPTTGGVVSISKSISPPWCLPALPTGRQAAGRDLGVRTEKKTFKTATSNRSVIKFKL